MIPRRRSNRSDGRILVRGRVNTAFTRTELLAVVALIMGLVTLWVMSRPERTAVIWEANCVGNLKEIGAALTVYSEESNQKLPFAFMQPKPGMPVTWDGLISTTLRVAMRGEYLDGPPPPVGLALRCPNDGIDAVSVDASSSSVRRSYSMTEHKMNRANWPPSEYNSTGVGLFWSAYRKRGNASYAALEGASTLPAVTLDMIQERARTILVTEQANAGNLVGRPKLATVKSTVAQVDETILPLSALHGGEINYLMADGHVESLEPDETVGLEGEISDSADTHFGMWTIVAGD